MSRGIVIWRHADAGQPLASPQADAARSLSALGRSQAASVGRWLATRLAGPVHVLCSPAPRARQTAAALRTEVLAEPALGLDSDLGACIHMVNRALAADDATLVLVGHQPMVGALCAHLLGVGLVALPVSVGVCWYFRQDAGFGGWRLDLVMHPEFVEPIAR